MSEAELKALATPKGEHMSIDNIPQHRFENGQFTKIDYDLTGSSPTTMDWEESLRYSGWEDLGRMPGHRNAEASYILCHLWRRRYPATDGGAFFIEVMWDGMGIWQVFCPTIIEFIQFIRDWLRPVINMMDQDFSTNVAIDLSAVLLDGETGLGCAVRYAMRKKEQEAKENRHMEYLRQRKQQGPA
jgi:hypothetical protein